MTTTSWFGCRPARKPPCTLVDRYHRALITFAAAFVPGQAVAEEVVQDTWMAVVRGIARFEERSSVKTWPFHIVANRAGRSAREADASIYRERVR